jgi:dTDP-4-amino-4,6-dideoxygalactose transaminase
MIPFNKPLISGRELVYIEQAVKSGHISGNGAFVKKCHHFFAHNYDLRKCFLTTSCTDALEMAALLADIVPGDEVIVPSFTFTSTANAFVLRGAKIVFADSQIEHPNIDPYQLEQLITDRTKAIVVMHYAGVACHMDEIQALAKKHNVRVIEDAAQCVDSFYKGRSLGSIGDFGAFSFHETKNIICGEGGMLSVNDQCYQERAEIVWEKGTNRAAFFRGDVDKYNWVDVGSSYLLSELNAAFLYAQLENLEAIQAQRKKIWNLYYDHLKCIQDLGLFEILDIPSFATNNYHMFYLVCKTHQDQIGLLGHLQNKGIMAVFHYLPLHKSPYYNNKYQGNPLPNSEYFSERIVRLPFFYELREAEIELVVKEIKSYFKID